MKTLSALVLFAGLFVTVVATGDAQQAATPATAVSPDARIWAGVFSAAQATRGKTTYDQYCTRCHGVGLAGGGRRGAPPLKDERFWLDFETQPLAALLSKIQRTMPADAPGTLRDEDYLDVLAYVLSVNAFPSGRGDLVAAGLDAVPIARQPGTVREVPNFGLVRVVGCLVAAEKGGWTLASSTMPAVTREEMPTVASRAEAAGIALGDATIQLLDTARFRSDTRPGRRVEVRGLLDKTSAETRLDVLSLAVVGEGCAG
jgi:quinoprotein glucose dehydrogenase